MNFLRTAILTLMLIGWLPATNGCTLAAAYPEIFSDCCASSASDSGDNCCLNCTSLEQALVASKSDSPVPVVSLQASDVSLNSLVTVSEQGEESVAELFSHPPPELVKTWQFIFRAALAPRAPNSAS